MTETTYEQIDDLFRQIRLQLLQVRERDAATAEELKSLLTQLEDCVESLVIDSLKLKSLESRPEKAAGPEKKRIQPRGSKEVRLKAKGSQRKLS